MHRRDWTALAVAVVALALAAASSSAPILATVAGALLILALAIVISRFLQPRTLVPLGGLFERPGPGQRWCAACGRPAPTKAACAVCRQLPTPRRERKGKEKAPATASTRTAARRKGD